MKKERNDKKERTSAHRTYLCAWQLCPPSLLLSACLASIVQEAQSAGEQAGVPARSAAAACRLLYSCSTECEWKSARGGV